MSRRAVGASLRRHEDWRVLRGETRFVDDLRPAGLLYLTLFRSPHPHARITRLHVDAALESPRVFAVITGQDLVGRIRPLPFFVAPPGLRTRRILPLAVDRVRYVGEPVVAVVASDRGAAEDALEKVSVDFETLPPVSDVESAVATDAPRLFDDWPDNVAWRYEIAAGDVDRAMRQASFVLERRFQIHRQYGAPLEPRAALASFDRESRQVTLWSTTQWPHVVWTVLSEVLQIPPAQLRVVAPDVGGGFGTKQDVYPEEVLVAFLASQLARPVKWTASRREDLQGSAHAREQTHHLRMAFRKDGRILGLTDHVRADIGALHCMSIGPQQLAVATLTGPYDIRNCRAILECVVTNKTPAGAYRGFGQPKSTFVVERTLDIAAAELHLDPGEIRLRNFIRPDAYPYRAPLGPVYDSGNYGRCLRAALRAVGYRRFRRRQRAWRRRGVLRGVGLAFYVESAGLAPAREMMEHGVRYYSGYESAYVSLQQDGTITVSTGLSPHGQGAETTLAQICADQLGVQPAQVRVRHGDTAESPYGFGTFGSRSAAVGGVAVLEAARKLRRAILQRAAARLRCSPREPQLRKGTVVWRGRRLSFRELAASDGPLEASHTYDPPGLTWSYGANVAIVDVDRSTGLVRVRRFLVMHDCGTLINPMLVEGQMHGGVAQGLAGALYERIRYDRDGQLATQTFIDYQVPTATDIPRIEVLHQVTPSPVNPLGAKGMGEGGAIGPPAAVMNAIADALGNSGDVLSEAPVDLEIVWRTANAG